MYDYGRTKVAWHTLDPRKTEGQGIEETLDYLKEDIHYLKRALKNMPMVLQLFEMVSRDPEVAEEVEEFGWEPVASHIPRIKRASQDFKALLTLFEKSREAIKKFEKEYESFLEQKAEGTWRGPGGLIEAVLSLPSARALESLQNDIAKMYRKLDTEIDWNLSQYLDDRDPRARKLERLGPGHIEDNLADNPPAAVLNRYLDPRFISKELKGAQTRIEDSRWLDEHYRGDLV